MLVAILRRIMSSTSLPTYYIYVINLNPNLALLHKERHTLTQLIAHAISIICNKKRPYTHTHTTTTTRTTKHIKLKGKHIPTTLWFIHHHQQAAK